jgi:hypothetical protein
MSKSIVSRSHSKTRTWPNSILKNKNGVIAVWVAIMAACLIGFLALAVDVGYMYVTRNELQNIADAAALAGCGELGRKYLELGFSGQEGYDVSSDAGDIKKAAKDVAILNIAAGVGIKIEDPDIIIGQWNWEKNAEKPNPNPTNIEPDAVQVTARRETDFNGPVATFFAQIFKLFGANADFFEASAVATAALSGPAHVDKGVLNVPFGLASGLFPEDCKDIISFSPTPSSCAGWHNWFDPHNAAAVTATAYKLIESHVDGSKWLTDYWPKWKINNNQAPNEVAPAVDAGDKIEMTGTQGATFLNGDRIKWKGTDNNEFDGYMDKDGNTITNMSNIKDPASFPALFDFYRMRDLDGDDKKWSAQVPVYYDPNCSNPNQTGLIVGFADIEIYESVPPPNSDLHVQVTCEIHYIKGRSGGAQFGNLKGSIPNLVE